MDETSDVRALEKISSEVDESQIKVILSNQCIKAQAFLLDKLKKQSERHKETCNYISSANLKLEAEIKQAEQEIRSMLIAQETIRSGNVEIKKEWLMAKVRKTEVLERVEQGKKRYEALWLECKARYESIPFVQKLLRATENAEALKNDIDGRDQQITSLYEDMRKKRKICIELDRKRAIELANFVVNEMPTTMELIKKKTKIINDLKKEIEDISNEQKLKTRHAVMLAEEPQHSKMIENKNNEIVEEDVNENDDDSFIPKLKLTNFDLDVIDDTLEKVKIKKNEIPKPIPIINETINYFGTNKIEPHLDERKSYEYISSPYFKSYKENVPHNFSKRKLINILEDIHINNNEAYNIVKKVNLENLQKVDEITSKEKENVSETLTFSKVNTPMKSENIEEVDMSCSITENIIIPPTQFLDITLTDGMPKKRVSFDVPSSLQINEIIEDVKDEIETANQTINSQLDVSVASEDSFMKIKDMILKKHNLDLSPQFVYAKNTALQKDDDKIITSKFFECNQDAKTDKLRKHEMEIEEEPKIQEPEEKQDEQDNLEEPKSPIKQVEPMEVDEVTVTSSPKITEVKRSDNPVSGLLFTHGNQAIPDSLNASMSTTGYEDLDIPHCIDSSLLLSPKADESEPGDNPDVQSQEVPNFLSGFRKTGLSFFGGPSTSQSKPDSSEQNDGNNFSFNFGGEKKNRGGLFSLFH